MTKQHINALKRHWTVEAERRLVGRTIVSVQWMTERHRLELGWCSAGVTLLLDDNTLIWPSTDDEGNNAGALFGVAPSGDAFILSVIR